MTVTAKAQPSATGRRLLLAQDESHTGGEVSGLLTDAGFDIVGHANDATQVVAMSTVLRPAATLIDLANGVQAAAAIHQQQLGPVVMMAGGDAPDLMAGAVHAGVMAYVVTPFTKERLVPAIEMAVARHADGTALRIEIAQISERLDARKTLDRAKGLLMTHQRMTEPEAFRFLQRTAMDHRTSMRSIANRVIERLPAG